MSTPSLTLRQRMFLLVGGAVIGALAIVWFGIRPSYEESVVRERMTIVQQFLDYVRAAADERLAREVTVVSSVVREVMTRPTDADNILRTSMGLDPGLLQVRISADGSDDDLVARQTGYPDLDVALMQAGRWEPSKPDSSVAVAIMLRSPTDLPLVVMRKGFALGGNRFFSTFFWDAAYLPDVADRAALSAGSAALWYVDSLLGGAGAATNVEPGANESGRVASIQFATVRDEEFIIVVSPFETVPLTVTAAVSEQVLLAPVRDLFLTSVGLIVGAGLLILLIAWWFTAAISRPIDLLAGEVTRLIDLDFSHPVSPPALPELRRMGESIETMRTALDRYQKMNVERIIVEEWKTRSLMSHGDDLIGITDGDGVFVFRNTGLDAFWAELTPGYSLRKLPELLGDDRVTVRSETKREERSEEELMTFLQKDIAVRVNERTEHHFRLKVVDLDRHEERIGSLVILHDLTEDRKIDQMRNDMINVIVHEMRNPAGAIRGMAEVIQESEEMEPNDLNEFIGHMYDAAQRLLDLINRFLDIQRLESGRVDYPASTFDLSQLVDAVVLSQKPYLMEKSLTVVVNKPDSLEVVAAPELLRDAIQNLLSNAIKYGDPDRTIQIDATQKNGTAVVAVTDNGYGIPPAEQEKLFTKFFRVRSNKAAAKQVGTGLGLAYVKEIMTYHGGSVEFSSDPSYGCRFSLNLPRTGKS